MNNTQDTIRKLEQSIAEAQRQIETLKKQSAQPQPKVGQVWRHLDMITVVVDSSGLGGDYRGKFYTVDLRGRLVDGPVDRIEDLGVAGRYFAAYGEHRQLVANSLAEYFAQQKAS